MSTTATQMASLRAAIEAVEDPEMRGVTIGQLGMVLDVRATPEGVEIDLAPTFLGCAAIGIITLDMQTVAQNSTATGTRCLVRTVHSVWSSDRISPVGVQRLRDLGIAVVRSSERLESTPCPFCAHPDLERRAGAGPTRCRSVAWCKNCRNVVEVMGAATAPDGAKGTYANV